ncbi:hypothetical protein cce_4650 [Crocosphaera subtropica ATCC 51142]|uniref:Diguanylate cyclase/phosphodiesterase n=1 Tax=Crocosphaera subtropica (strain ATCC 51142 / BH68) TaxID=43989 RepID=B1WW70_CROS5|nr:EAL domain-containing protein [Crocosphaera subtropica]ACB53998.1 hypothetical protein cce_4650 [Crocosphaera subtropica ATCC 51142]
MLTNVLQTKTDQDNKHILAFNLTNNQQIIHLEDSQYSIGRSPENSIVIESEAISRFHATILKQINKDGEISFVIIDGVPSGEPSRNGLFINGNKCLKHKLEHGDIIQFEPETQANYYVLQKKSEEYIKNLLPRVSAKTTSSFPSFLPPTSNEPVKQTLIVAEPDLSHSLADFQKFASLIELSPNPILEIDYQGKLIYANSSAKLHFRDLKQTQMNHPIVRGLFNNNESRQGNLLVREITIGQVVFEQHIHYLPQEKLIRCYLFDVTQRREAEEILKYKAFHDELTGLPNRAFLHEHLSLALGNAQRNKSLMAILLLDVDGFKNINDTLGHSIGDLILKCFAKRLQSQVRQGDLVCRWGGDEFIILLSRIKEPKEAAQFAERLLEVFKHPITVEGNLIYLKSSIGITIYPEDGQDQETLLKSADLALYKTKNSGRNNYQFYHSKMASEMKAEFELENALHKAVEQEEFYLHYQPQVNIRTGKIEGIEALIRWESSSLGPISPQKFIPLAEKTGLIQPIGEWVIKQACQQAKTWQNMGLEFLKIAINLSPQQFQQFNLIDRINEILHSTQLPPQFLELEVTESSLMQNIDLTRETLKVFRDMEISISMDDFGTGHSSLAYLKQFPFQTLKIDRSFIKDLHNNTQEQAIVAAIMTLSRGLNLRVVAEGIENTEQLNILKTLECEQMQGYFFSRPLSAQKMMFFLSNFQKIKD